MAKSDFARLPSPHAAVRVSWEPCDFHVRIVYTGPPDALIAAGAIEPHMALGARGAGRNDDQRGDQYCRDKYKDGRLRVIRLITSSAAARALPGIPHDCLSESISWLLEHPGELHISREVSPGYEEIAGTKELLIARGFAREETFSGPASQNGDDVPIRFRCVRRELMDEYFSIDRRVPEELTISARRYIDAAMVPLGSLRHIAEQFPVQLQARVGAHIDALSSLLQSACTRPSAPRMLRLVVDNTQTLERAAHD